MKTWRFLVKPNYRDGSVQLAILSKGCGSCDRVAYLDHAVRTPVVQPQAVASASRGTFSFTARRGVKGTVTATLKGKRSSGGWQKITKQSTTKQFGSAGDYTLRTSQISRPGHRCRAYAHCKLVVKGTTFTRVKPGSKWYKVKEGHDSSTHRIK